MPAPWTTWLVKDLAFSYFRTECKVESMTNRSIIKIILLWACDKRQSFRNREARGKKYDSYKWKVCIVANLDTDANNINNNVNNND